MCRYIDRIPEIMVQFCYLKTILRHWNCFLLSVATDGRIMMDMENVGPPSKKVTRRRREKMRDCWTKPMCLILHGRLIWNRTQWNPFSHPSFSLFPPRATLFARGVTRTLLRQHWRIFVCKTKFSVLNRFWWVRFMKITVLLRLIPQRLPQ